MTVLVVLVVVLLVVVAAGVLQRRRSGVVRVLPAPGDPVRDEPVPGDPALLDELRAAGLGACGGGPLVLHFSADWCGPCARVRPVVEQVCTELGGVRHLEVDVAAHPELARRFGVLSLPTVLLLDAQLAARARVGGVPSAVDLRAALVPLTGTVRPDHRDAR